MLRWPLRCSAFPSIYAQFRGVFTDPIRRKKLESAIEYNTAEATQQQLPVVWDSTKLEAAETVARKRIRAVDFVIEVRDARIPVSTLHPKLRGWIGRKPRIMIMNKADLISHQNRVEWERYFDQKNINVIWTAATLFNGGIPTIIRRFFDANFEVNRRRRKTNLPLRRNRAVLACVVGHPNVGKETLLKRLAGDEPQFYKGRIPDKGRPDLVDRSLTWYKVEGAVYLMKEMITLPPPLDNPLACTRLALCENYTDASINERLLVEHLISHMASMKDIGNVLDRIYDDVAVHPKSLPATEFLREASKAKFEGDMTEAARHILQNFRHQTYGPMALEMPYMIRDNFKFDEPLIYDKDNTVGLATGICSQF